MRLQKKADYTPKRHCKSNKRSDDSYSYEATIMANDVQKKKKKVKVVGGGAGAGAGGEKKAKKRGKRRETYAMYIYKVLKQVGSDVVRHVYTLPPLQKKDVTKLFFSRSFRSTPTLASRAKP